MAGIQVELVYTEKTNCKVQRGQVKTCRSVCSRHKQDSLNKLEAVAYVSRLPALNKSQTYSFFIYKGFINFVKLYFNLTINQNHFSMIFVVKVLIGLFSCSGTGYWSRRKIVSSRLSPPAKQFQSAQHGVVQEATSPYCDLTGLDENIPRQPPQKNKFSCITGIFVPTRVRHKQWLSFKTRTHYYYQANVFKVHEKIISKSYKLRL